MGLTSIQVLSGCSALHRCPPLLTVHVKRFQQDMRGRLSKIDGAVPFPINLNLAPFCDSKVFSAQPQSCWIQRTANKPAFLCCVSLRTALQLCNCVSLAAEWSVKSVTCEVSAAQGDFKAAAIFQLAHSTAGF